MTNFIPEKLYSGAIVNYPEDHGEGRPDLMKRVLTSLREMHSLLKVNKRFNQEDEHLTSFDIAHHAGLSLEQEQELLGLTWELHRQEYLKRHLKSLIAVIKETEALKERIKLNGHFKQPESLNL